MKKMIVFLFFLPIFVFAGGGRDDPRIIAKTDLSLKPTNNQSEIILSYSKGVGSIFVYIDNKEMAQCQVYRENSQNGEIYENGQEKVIVNAGVQNIRLVLRRQIAGDSEKGTSAHWEDRTFVRFTLDAKSMTSTTINISSESEQVSENNYRYKINYNIQEPQRVGATSGISNGSSGSSPAGIEGALSIAVEQLTSKISKESTIAIVYITADDKNVVDFITGELEFELFSKDFQIIDRSQLDSIRKEQNFQLSGEVDDDTAVSIGKFSGASVIITGRIDGAGSLRRLRLRAIDTQTAKLVGVASATI